MVLVAVFALSILHPGYVFKSGHEGKMENLSDDEEHILWESQGHERHLHYEPMTRQTLWFKWIRIRFCSLIRKLDESRYAKRYSISPQVVLKWEVTSHEFVIVKLRCIFSFTKSVWRGDLENPSHLLRTVRSPKKNVESDGLARTVCSPDNMHVRYFGQRLWMTWLGLASGSCNDLSARSTINTKLQKAELASKLSVAEVVREATCVWQGKYTKACVVSKVKCVVS